jgi:dephospho-CoA kinase
MSPSLLRVALTGGIATGKSHCLSRFAQLGVPVIDADAIARKVVQPGTPGLEAVANRFGPSVLRSNGELDRAVLAGMVFGDPVARADLEAMIHPAVYSQIETWFDSEVPRLPASKSPSLPGSQPSILNGAPLPSGRRGPTPDAPGSGLPLAAAPALEAASARSTIDPSSGEPGRSPARRPDSLSSPRPRALFAIADIPLLYETGHDRDFDQVIVATCTPEQQLQRLIARGLSETEARQRIESQLPIGEKARRADYLIDTSGSVQETDRQVLEVWEKLRALART